MAKSRLFDNIMQMIQVTNTVASTTVISTEIDLELPRGYVAKIHKVIVYWRDVFDKMASGDKDNELYAVLLDPDDATSLGPPGNSVEHDVLCNGSFEAAALAADYMGVHNSLRHETDFSHLEGLDILSARNMRFNTQGGNTDYDGSEMECQIYYTLEAIKDTQIMELLDIL